jgi:hypothetical protein
LNISEVVNATSQQGGGRTANSAGHALKRPPGQTPEGGDAVPKPRSLAEEPENLLVRAHPAATADDPLQRLPEKVESHRYKNRPRKGTTIPASSSDARPAEQAQKPRCPYDPPPTRQRDLDFLA